MQEAFHSVHQHDDSQGNVNEEVDSNDYDQSVGTCDSSSDGLRQEDLGELAVGERQGPKTKVRSGIGDTSKHKFDGFDDLMDGNFTDVVLFMVAMVVMLLHLSLLLLCDQLVRNLVIGEVLVDVVLLMLFVGRR